MLQERNFYEEGSLFIKRLFQEFQQSTENFLKPHWDIDHLCYRTSNLEKYQQVCQSLSLFARKLAESNVGGRPISTFKLSVPFRVEGFYIDVVEVPAPKTGEALADGFEHFEVVLDIPFGHLIQAMQNKGLVVSVSGKSLNNEIKVKLSSGTVKFHAMSLESLIRFEGCRAFESLSQLKILDTLKEFDPLIAGTFPLGTYTNESDVDLILEMKSKAKLISALEENFSACPGFKITHLEVQSRETLLCNFDFKKIPYEIFAQDVPSIQQSAYRHFLIEERLLKLGSEKFFQRIQQYRSEGLKTEPAFAKALGITSEPFEALLSMQKISNVEVLEFLARVC